MKMMGRTSMMSTSGVTLMPWMASSSWTWACAISGRLPRRDHGRLELRHQLAAEALGRGRAGLDRALEEVERGDGRQRHDQADGGRDQRLGQPRHHGTRGLAARRTAEVCER